ncbi:MAG: type III pantothenate kinase [Oscillospiraceae bacterium]|nr:type III pantothenate kinase [Oscillospiraceae bacterium]
MILVIDVGNTNMEFGLYREGGLVAQFRLSTSRDVTSDEIGLMTRQFFAVHKINHTDIKDTVISSVVPQVMYSIMSAIKKYIGKRPLIINEDIKVNIKNMYTNPGEVGADRLVNSYAAFRKYGGPLIITDFGTATTFDVVGAEGEYLGGVIYPGIKVSMNALVQNASKLPRVEVAAPDRVIGKNTAQSMQSGILYGYIGVVEKIRDEISRELGQKTNIIATGGLSQFLQSSANVFQVIDKTLTLEGLYIIYEESRVMKI